MITYEKLRRDEALQTYITRADESLRTLGYTEHSFAHVTRVADTAAYLLEMLHFDPHTVELARIAGYLHDIGNLVNRVDHSQSGAIIAFRLLEHMGMPAADLATVVTAIGNHDEGTGVAVNSVAAALIIADKSDVRRTRVRNADVTAFDIHDRVNYSVTSSSVVVDEARTTVQLSLEIDTTISPVMDYFEIFLSRMTMCRKAAETLGLAFRLIINGQRLF